MRLPAPVARPDMKPNGARFRSKCVGFNWSAPCMPPSGGEKGESGEERVDLPRTLGIW